MASTWRRAASVRRTCSASSASLTIVGIVLFLAEFDEFDAILHLLLESAHAVDAVIELLALAHQLLGFCGIVPEVGILRLVVQPVQSSYRLIPVKDASSAGLWPA